MGDGAERDRTNVDARERVDKWADAWRDAGGIVLLLDFDGTLAPIVARPELAGISPEAEGAIRGLLARGATVAVVSGRGLADARSLVGIPEIAYAGNHGMEIEMPGLRRVHPEAEETRPALDAVRRDLEESLRGVPGVIVEDKGLTLSIHYREVARDSVERVRRSVFAAVEPNRQLRVTEGKEVLEIRPDVDWHKGRAVEFLLDRFDPPAGTPVIYIGDDRTDEDAFETLRKVAGGEGVLVSEAAGVETAAVSRLKTTEEVAELLDLLLHRAPSG